MTMNSVTRFVVAIALAALPLRLAAHPALVRSVPAKDATLVAAPAELRLTFNEAVELALTSVTLEDSHGTAVPIGKLARSADSTRVVIAVIATTLSNGRYTVKWRAAGKDGHAVRGQYSFVVAVPLKPTDAAAATAPIQIASFDAGSPAYVAIRWVRYVSLLALIGAAAFVLLVLPRVRMKSPETGARLCSSAMLRAETVGKWAVGTLLVSSIARLVAQVAAVAEPAAIADPNMFVTVAIRTTWGNAWLLEVAAAGFIAWALVRRRPQGRWTAIAAATPFLALASALSGHAVAVAQRTTLAVTVDALHVLAAGGWIGSLFTLVAAGLPAGRALGTESSELGIRALVEAFSPTALAAASVLALSGALTAWLHFGSLRDLWMSEFGRTLLVKLGVLSLVAATGAYNWRRVLPALGRAGGGARLQRSATLELMVAAVVVAVTAVLVATPTPMEAVP